MCPLHMDNIITSHFVTTRNYRVDGDNRWYLSATQLRRSLKCGRSVCWAHLSNSELPAFSCRSNIAASHFWNLCYQWLWPLEYLWCPDRISAHFHKPVFTMLRNGASDHNFCVHRIGFSTSPLWSYCKLSETSHHLPLTCSRFYHPRSQFVLKIFLTYSLPVTATNILNLASATKTINFLNIREGAWEYLAEIKQFTQ